jgi:alpha-L-fucosidase
MKQKQIAYCALLLLQLLLVKPLMSQWPGPQNLAARKEFQDMKLGMFIHWGASSVLGHGEWVMNNRNIPATAYQQLQHIFNPQQFDARQWVSTAKASGMRYITFISRHHDGFSNWDTQYSDWKITNTPYGKDVLRQLADECAKQDIKLFIYYSLLDWYRTDYQYETGKTGKGTGRKEKSNWPSYLQFMKNQLTELLTLYGPIAGIWLDGHWDQLDNDYDKTLQSKVNWQYPELYNLIHTLQPQCLISNNHHLTPLPGEDFQAFEKDLPGHNTTGFGGASISALPLETCETMNDSWGFNIGDVNYKTAKQLIQYLVKAAGHNANFLLNVGPMPNGKIQQAFLDTLAIVGKWMQQNGAAIYNTRGNVIPPQAWGTCTTNGTSLYVHVLNTPATGNYIFVPGLQQKIKACKQMSNGTPVKYKQQAEGCFIYLDGIATDNIDLILVLQLE